MKSLTQSCEAKIEIKKSVFIAHLCEFGEFKALLSRLKAEHNKARHFVWAFRYLNELGQIVEDKSDDGEPKGSAALPCLNVLRGGALINVAVIVVRYFGGIKLGTGGLVRAYSRSVSAALDEALQNALLAEFECKKSLNLTLPLSLYARMEHYLNKNQLEFTKEFTPQTALLDIKVSEKEQEALLELAKRLGVGV